MDLFNKTVSLIPIFSIIFIFILFLKYVFRTKLGIGKSKTFHFKKEEYLITKTEHTFFNLLNEILGEKYFVFPQVHLSSFLDHKIRGQSWQGALNHIQRKSVDYLICDKDYLKPILAIELDGKSHQREDRTRRDREVERIFTEAGLPLLRFDNKEIYNRGAVERKLATYLPQPK
jgi:very-short-patch-repair endonuclease